MSIVFDFRKGNLTGGINSSPSSSAEENLQGRQDNSKLDIAEYNKYHLFFIYSHHCLFTARFFRPLVGVFRLPTYNFNSNYALNPVHFTSGVVCGVVWGGGTRGEMPNRAGHPGRAIYKVVSTLITEYFPGLWKNNTSAAVIDWDGLIGHPWS